MSQFLFETEYTTKVPILKECHIGKMKLWQVEHFYNIFSLHFWAWLLNTIPIMPKSEDKCVVKVFNPSEFHFSEVTFFQNWYFSCAAWNVFPINSLGRVSAPLGPPSSGITGLHHLVHYCYIKWDCRLTKFFDITVSIIYLIVMQWRDFFRLVSVLEIFFFSPWNAVQN